MLYRWQVAIAQNWRWAKARVIAYARYRFSRTPHVYAVQSEHDREYGIDSPIVRAMAAELDAWFPRRGEWKYTRMPPVSVPGQLTSVFAYEDKWYTLVRYRQSNYFGNVYAHVLYARFEPVQA